MTYFKKTHSPKKYIQTRAVATLVFLIRLNLRLNCVWIFHLKFNLKLFIYFFYFPIQYTRGKTSS